MPAKNLQWGPGRRPSAKRIPDQQWESHRDVLTRLRKGSITLNRIIVIMEREYDFKATEHQYRLKFEKWNLPSPSSTKMAAEAGTSDPLASNGQTIPMHAAPPSDITASQSPATSSAFHVSQLDPVDSGTMSPLVSDPSVISPSQSPNLPLQPIAPPSQQFAGLQGLQSSKNEGTSWQPGGQIIFQGDPQAPFITDDPLERSWLQDGFGQFEILHEESRHTGPSANYRREAPPSWTTSGETLASPYVWPLAQNQATSEPEYAADHNGFDDGGFLWQGDSVL